MSNVANAASSGADDTFDATASSVGDATASAIGGKGGGAAMRGVWFAIAFTIST